MYLLYERGHILDLRSPVIDNYGRKYEAKSELAVGSLTYPVSLLRNSSKLNTSELRMPPELKAFHNNFDALQQYNSLLLKYMSRTMGQQPFQRVVKLMLRTASLQCSHRMQATLIARIT